MERAQREGENKGRSLELGFWCHQLRTRLPRPATRSRNTGVVGERGAELLEFALVVPLMVMLVIGMFWFGRAWNTMQTLTRAAREGARFAVAPTCASCGNQLPSDAQVRSVVDASLVASTLDPSQVTGFSIQRGQILNPGTTPQTVGLIVSFSYPFQIVLPFTPVHLTTVSMAVQVQMRQE